MTRRTPGFETKVLKMGSRRSLVAKKKLEPILAVSSYVEASAGSSRLSQGEYSCSGLSMVSTEKGV